MLNKYFKLSIFVPLIFFLFYVFFSKPLYQLQIDIDMNNLVPSQENYKLDSIDKNLINASFLHFQYFINNRYQNNSFKLSNSYLKPNMTIFVSSVNYEELVELKKSLNKELYLYDYCSEVHSICYFQSNRYHDYAIDFLDSNPNHSIYDVVLIRPKILNIFLSIIFYVIGVYLITRKSFVTK